MKIIVITITLIMAHVSFADLGFAAPSSQPAGTVAERPTGTYLQTPVAGAEQSGARKSKSKPRVNKEKRKGGGHLGHH